MKKYINSEGKTAHFIGGIPKSEKDKGWREMTAKEIQAEQEARQARSQFKEEVLDIFETSLKDLPGIAHLFTPLKDACIKEFDNNNDVEVYRIINTAHTFGLPELENLKQALLLKLQGDKDV